MLKCSMINYPAKTSLSFLYRDEDLPSFSLLFFSLLVDRDLRPFLLFFAWRRIVSSLVEQERGVGKEREACRTV